MEIKILLAEDDDVNVNMMQALLTESGYQVITANDGVQALKAVQTHHPDIILTDIQMPVMSGTEFTRKLKADKKFYRIPIFAITSFSLIKQQEMIRKSGVDELFVKPVAIQKLLATIKKYLEKNRC